MKCFKSPFFIVAALFLLSACESSPPQKSDADIFGFMIGTWNLEDQGRQYTESWTRTGDQLNGWAYEVAVGDTVFEEQMNIYYRESDGWVMSVRTAEQNTGNTVFFTLAHHNKGEAMFENLAHDFPKRIAYTSKSTHTMQALVDGGEGSEQKLEFSFVKAK